MAGDEMTEHGFRSMVSTLLHEQNGVSDAQFYCELVGTRIKILPDIVKKTEKTSQRVLQMACTRLHEVKHES